ncbi:MAG: TonB-dependent receptor [Gammaproteobacteria bacterium]|nr:TonB-dependent receptor [Gammaproteobacteria bacterium]MDH4314297.1 TonB-dependent receptor [Gammaproteobacteria bacterium]MDH5215057.1 TonB-dependent receptor [Gammaproteobacteria bacterium]
MKYLVSSAGALCAALAINLSTVQVQTASAQEAEVLEEVVVTGSRIRRNPLDEAAAIMDITRDDINKSGMTNLGDALQNLPISGSAINSQFNVPGNSGFPQDGSGIGAGAVELAIRNVGAKRTLVLVDGRRWVAGGSASGVASTVDLNTVPDNVIQRVEVLQDGASAIYGSDAIGGVVNIITDQDFDGLRFDAQGGGYLSEGDGESYEFAGLWGGGNDATHVIFSASYKEERGVDTADRSRSAYPTPDATSCAAGGCSSFTPQGRFVLGPNFNFWDATLNDGVVNDGMGNIPVFDPNDPNGGDFHAFGATDRFNFNGPGYNYLRTPNKRTNLYTNVTHQLSDTVEMFIRGSYTNRSSATKAAPEPLCLGNGCGNAINDNFVISALNPFNPFGEDLSVANGNLEFFARRPLESGRRLFFQEIDVYMLSTGLIGEFAAGNRTMYWDLTASYGDNRGFQEKYNSHNAAKLQVAMGDPAVCAATPNCVPFNFFGGQGVNGEGSITEEMLDFVGYTQRDYSEQTLKDFAFNITGDIVSLPGGDMAFAAGIEYRDHQGSYRPDPIAERGETAGIPAGATAGAYDVTEYYAELNIPLISGAQLADYLELNIAGRNSDYSTSGSKSTYKVSGLWRPIEELSFRASFSTGIRAPGIGELFGGAAREDFTYLDPCADVLGTIPAANGGRQETGPQPQSIIDNCAALGVGPGLAQLNPQQSAVSAGNPNLAPETSDNWTAGLVYSPEWADGANWTDGLTVSLDFYNLQIDDAIQGRPPGDVVTACVNTLNPLFCDLVPRSSSGQLGLINNRLQNIGGIEASGYDLMFNYLAPEFSIGQFGLTLNATYLSEYLEKTANIDNTVTVTDRTGQHTNETFQRAFPEWRAVTTIDWTKERWNGALVFRWVDEMITGANKLDSAMFTDLRVSYNPSFMDDALTVTLGFNNVLDEDPPVCNPCGSIGMSRVSHDIPGTVGYLRVTYQHE